MLDFFEEQLIDGAVSRAEQSRVSYNIQTEEFRNLNANLQTYLSDIKTIDEENRQLQENIEQIRIDYINSLENHLKRLPNDFHQQSQTLTEANLERYRLKTRAKRFMNDREELKRRIHFINKNEKVEKKRLNALQKYERTVRNEFNKLNEHIQKLSNYVENEKQNYQQALDTVDNLHVQLEQTSIERSKTEFEIQTLKEEVKLMQTTREFLDDECETILAAQTDANEYLLSRLNESINRIRDDFDKLNQTQLKQMENEYKQLLKNLEENLQTTPQQPTSQVNHEQLQDDYHSITQELTTLNNHNQTLSERALAMEADFCSLRNERKQDLSLKDNELEQSKIELQTLNEKIHHLVEYDRNLKFELTLYRGVLESEYRRKQQQQQTSPSSSSSISTSHLIRPTTLRSNKNSLTDKTVWLTNSTNANKSNNQQQEKILRSRTRVQSEYDSLTGNVSEQSNDVTSTNTTPTDIKLTNEKQQLAESFNQKTQDNIGTAKTIAQDAKGDQTSSRTSSTSASTQKSPPEPQPLSTKPPSTHATSPTDTTPVVFDIHSSSSTSPQDDQTLSSVQQASSNISVDSTVPSDNTAIVSDHKPLTSNVQQSPQEHQPSSRKSSVGSAISTDIQHTSVSANTAIVSDHREPTSDIQQSTSAPPVEHQPSELMTSAAPTTTSSSNVQRRTSSVDSSTTSDIQRSSNLITTPTTSDHQLPTSDVQQLSAIPPQEHHPSSNTSPMDSSEPSDPHQSSTSETTEADSSSNVEVSTQNIDAHEKRSPLTTAVHHTVIEINRPRPADESNNESQLNQSLDPTNDKIDQKESTTHVTDELSTDVVDRNERHSSIQSLETPSSEEYEVSLAAERNHSRTSSFASAGTSQSERKQSFSQSHATTPSTQDDPSELEQNESSDRTTREERINSSLTNPSEETHLTDKNSSTVVRDHHPFDDNLPESNPLSGKRSSTTSSLTDVEEINSSTSQPFTTRSDDLKLAGIMQELYYVFHELANYEDLVEINNDLPDKLLDRLDFPDPVTRTLFDSLLRKYLVQAAAQTTRPATLDWNEFRDIIFPILSGRYTEQHIRKLFNLLDTSQDGYLSSQEIHELLQALHISEPTDLAQNIITEYDTDHDDKLSVDELIEAFKNTGDINEHVLSKEIENEGWFNLLPAENQTITLEVPVLNFTPKIDDRLNKEILLLGRIFKKVGANSATKQLDSQKKDLSMQITNEFIANDVNISSDDLQLFIQLFLNKKQNTDPLINWMEFRDMLLPIINHGFYSKNNLKQWFNILDTDQNGRITREQTIQLLRLLQVSNPEETLNKLNDILNTHANNTPPWTFNDLSFALDNVDETATHLLTDNERIALFDIDWLSNNVF